MPELLDIRIIRADMQACMTWPCIDIWGKLYHLMVSS